MWNLPLSTFLAFITLIITVILSIIWAFITKNDDQENVSEDNE